MATIQDFTNRLMKIAGVNGYILVRHDGHIITHNVENPESLSSMIVFSGLSCEALKTVAGTTYFSYFMLTRETMEKFFIFPIDNFFLGIFQSADAYSPDLVNKITQFIQAVTKHRIKYG